jgi:ATP-binding cassette subfamily B (MDR/TAP) protein 1
MAAERRDVKPSHGHQAYTHLSNEAAVILSRQMDSTPAVVKYHTLFRYATNYDIFYLAVSALSATAAGATLPLMTIIYGNLAGTVSRVPLQAKQPTNIVKSSKDSS